MAVDQTNSTVGVTSTTIFAATNSRAARGVIIQNTHATGVIYINLAGDTATTSDIKVSAGYALPVPFSVANDITAIADGAGVTYTIAFA